MYNLLELDIQVYVTPEKISINYPEIKFLYTIKFYDSNKTYSDNYVSLALCTNMKPFILKEVMKEKFDCILHEQKIFFKTKKQCKEAINLLNAMVIMNKLI